MEKSYYPLAIGLEPGTIISKNETLPVEGSDKNHYGGWLAAESIRSPELAQQLVDAYNEKFGPKEKTENSAHSFTEGSEPTYAFPSELNIPKHWPGELFKKVDVEKVIQDLIDTCKIFGLRVEGLTTDQVIEDRAIQNAEAALGLIKAFKSSEGHIGEEITKRNQVDIPSLKEGRLQKITPKDVDDKHLWNKRLRIQEHLEKFIGGWAPDLIGNHRRYN